YFVSAVLYDAASLKYLKIETNGGNTMDSSENSKLENEIFQKLEEAEREADTTDKRYSSREVLSALNEGSCWFRTFLFHLSSITRLYVNLPLTA
ncbi:MAG: hypothetical protein LUC17_02025, partial [Oscillospiraceae bacterium]|nr:hypothetical protein [Oscillospiraceae bacterium]